MSNDLFTQIESWQVSESLKIKNISKEEIERAEKRLSTGKALSCKQSAIIADLLYQRTCQNKYLKTAFDNYQSLIIDLVSKLTSAKSSGSYLSDCLSKDLTASFIRCYIHKKSHEKLWLDSIIPTMLGYLKEYKNNESLQITDMMTFFLWLVQKEEDFNSALEIYSNSFLQKHKSNAHDTLEWLFNEEDYCPPPNTGHLFNTNNGKKNNLKNILVEARNRAKKNTTVYKRLKVSASNSYIQQKQEEFKTYGQIEVVPNWILEILSKEQKDILETLSHSEGKYFYASDNTVYPIENSEEIKKAILFIESSNDIEDIVRYIIDFDTDEFITNNTTIFKKITGPGMPILSNIYTPTGEVESNDWEKIKHNKLDALYKKMFDSVPVKLSNKNNVLKFLRSSTAIQAVFHETVAEYLSFILNPSYPDKIRSAVINQLSLLTEPILSYRNKEFLELKKQNNGYTSLKRKYLKYILDKSSKCFTEEDSDFLNGDFLRHRIKVSHGETYLTPGNCYFILTGIMRLVLKQNIKSPKENRS